MSFIECNDITQYNLGSNSIVWMPLAGVIIGALIARSYVWWDRKRAIKENGELYEFYLTSAVPDILDQIKEIENYTVEISEYKESDGIIDGAFLFDFFDKIDFLLLRSYFKKNGIENYIEKSVEVFGCLSLGKNELKKLSVIIAEYEVIALSYDEQFYDHIVELQRDIKIYEDTTWETIDDKDSEKLNSLNNIIDKYLDNNCQYDLATYIAFDKSFINELMKHPYHLDQKHKLYHILLSFTDDWHKLKIKAENKQTLHLNRIGVILAELQTIYEILSGKKLSRK